jgi:hypothetical protein
MLSHNHLTEHLAAGQSEIKMGLGKKTGAARSCVFLARRQLMVIINVIIVSVIMNRVSAMKTGILQSQLWMLRFAKIPVSRSFHSEPSSHISLHHRFAAGPNKHGRKVTKEHQNEPELEIEPSIHPSQ